MTVCEACGAGVELGEQCPRCGALAYRDADAPALDVEPVGARRHREGVLDATASDAQLGGGVDGAAAIVAEAPGGAPRGRPLEARVDVAAAQRPSSPGFAERQRPARVTYWRLTRAPVLLILGWFTLSHLAAGSRWVFIDNLNLLLHEAGHVMWGWDGPVLAALGGTIGQLTFPVLFALYFARWHKQRFAAIVCVWWLGENLAPISLYMDDAIATRLPLIGGDVHDWNYLFGEWGVLRHTHRIADVTFWTGVAIMVGSLALLVLYTIRPRPAELV